MGPDHGSAAQENTIERGVVLSHGQPMNWEAMQPGHETACRARKGKANDLEGMIEKLVRLALQKLEPDANNLYDRLVRGVEKELLEQVLPLCDNILVKAAARLGINRNTLHKKINEMRNSTGENDVH